ncbi:MAG: ABC transporter substrate-binding protein [Dehalococcoidia bacterium]
MNRTMDRRSFLRLGLGAGVALAIPAALIGCSSEEDAPSATATNEGAATGTGTADATAAAEATRGPSTGTLRISEPFLPATIDVDAGGQFNILSLGMSETLFRYTSDLRTEPWLATSLERVDDLTWKVQLRDDVTFWDGSPMDADAVVTSFQRMFEKQPGTADLLPPDSELTADGYMLTIKTPRPIGLMERNLAAAQLAVKKAISDEDVLYTGPFRATAFTARDSITLEAYPAYRGGPAWVERIEGRQVGDTAARTLAVQAGDVEIAQALLPADVPTLEAAGLAVSVAPWARQHMLIVNVNRAPLSDVAVRRALSLVVDRQLLVDTVLDGVGEAAFGIAPASIGLDVTATHSFDPAEAASVLDAAGWVAGDDGIREKDGQRLAFKLGTYPGRAELEQFAVAILDMAKAVGMELTIEQFEDVEKALASNEFDVTTYSIGSAAFGDVSRLLSILYVPSARNPERYDNPEVTSRFQQYLETADPAEHARLLREMEELIGADIPVIPLVNPFQVVASSTQVTGFEVHPLDSYKYHADIRLQA